MENAKYSGYDKEITEVIKSVVNEYFPSDEAEIALNYQKLNPTFNPYEAVKKKSAVSENSLASDNKEQAKKSEEFDYDKLSENYHAEEPRYSFEQVILPETLKTQINEAVSTVLVEHKVFDEWGLRTIIPNASSALSFYGPPGTGKSMAAEAIAQKLGKKILRATYADIESKFHGEGPKMVKAIFRAAERDDAVLFLDESDSLLSKRLTNVTDGSAQAINSMRSQLLICLEQFKGIVIFATNLVVNYDKAFLSRLINIEFTKPDKEARYSIWYQHLKGKGLRIPLSDDVDINELAEKYEFCGREIKNSVKDACVVTAIAESEFVSQETLIKSAEKTKIEYEKVMSAEDHTVIKKELTDEQKDVLKEAMQKKIDEAKTVKANEI
ncbi:MAG: ATP-binding protein [Ruminococcus sp.]|nr:ATP-binding protein [Ruminococcus sp.]